MSVDQIIMAALQSESNKQGGLSLHWLYETCRVKDITGKEFRDQLFCLMRQKQIFLTAEITLYTKGNKETYSAEVEECWIPEGFPCSSDSYTMSIQMEILDGKSTTIPRLEVRKLRVNYR